MSLELSETPVVDLGVYANLPSTFESHSVFDVRESPAGFELLERTIATPYRKDYDEFESPLLWSRDFDTRNWVLISASRDGQRIGGLIVARATPGVLLLEDRPDLAVLWDLRVSPAHRRQAVATSLLRSGLMWARRYGCTEAKVETQNTNPAACKFYMHNGFVLSQVLESAYPELPDDVQLIWRKKFV
jgi:GNAT superfamily N-acetyltransferase